ncbi:MAG: MlaD family protein [Acidimicrobiales bacterium]
MTVARDEAAVASRTARHTGAVRSAANGVRRRSIRASTVVASSLLVAGLVALGIWVSSSPGTYPVSAVFPSGQGLFSGAAVRLLGVQVGTVTDVEYSGGAVHVSMEVNGAQSIPADVHAALVAPLLLGQPDIELSPGYTGGPTLRSGATIAESRTAVPVSTDELLKQLQRVLGAVRPTSLHNLVGNLALDLAGQGGQLHQLITSASGTLQLLAAKGDNLGRLNGSLAQLTGTLRANENQLLDLVQQYETVSGVIAGHQQALGASINDLSKASAQLAGLISPNLKPLEQDVAVVATAGRTLDRNLGNLDSVMASSRLLFAAAHRAYDPRYKWLNLNNQLAPGLTVDQLEGMIRDRLAGICRRVLAHHSAGLSAAAKATLATCGNQNSGYFDSILGVIPTIIAKGGLTNPGGSSPPSPGALLGPGLAKVPGLSAAERHKVSSAGSSPASSKSAPGATTHHPKTQQKKKSCQGVDGGINCILGPLPPLGSSSPLGSGSSGVSGAPSSLLGVLLAGIHGLGGSW